MNAAAEVLQKFNIPFEIDIVSAHRTPDKMFDYAKSAVDRGLMVIIAGAGGAAHLPGMVVDAYVGFFHCKGGRSAQCSHEGQGKTVHCDSCVL